MPDRSIFRAVVLVGLGCLAITTRLVVGWTMTCNFARIVAGIFALYLA
jgi:hypothetical protein